MSHQEKRGERERKVFVLSSSSKESHAPRQRIEEEFEWEDGVGEERVVKKLDEEEREVNEYVVEEIKTDSKVEEGVVEVGSDNSGCEEESDDSASGEDFQVSFLPPTKRLAFQMEYNERSMKSKGYGSLSEVEPYVAYLFRHWDKTARLNPGFDGQAVQELLWQQWVSLESAELASRQRSEVKMKAGKRRREREGAMVVTDLVSEMLDTITEAEDVASQLIEELLDRVCPRNKGIFFDHMAKTVLGELKGAELGLVEIKDAAVMEELSRRLCLRS